MVYYDVIIKDNQYYQNHTITFSHEATIQCDIGGSQALADSWWSCAVYKLPFILETIGFGYITSVLAVVIILISLFGGIKDNYKLIILNQAIWDLFVSYDFICEKPSRIYFQYSDPKIASQLWNEGSATCFYSTSEKSPSWRYFFKRFMQFSVHYIPFFLLLLLSVSRILALFGPRFYARHSTTVKTTVTLVILNIAALIVISFEPIFSQINHLLALKYCNCSDCSVNDWCVWNYLTNDETRTYILMGIAPVFSLACLLISTVLIAVIMIKICLQAKYQFNHNQKNLYTSLRITTVLFFQLLMAAMIFFLIFYGDILYFLLGTITSQSFHVAPWILRLRDAHQCLNILKSIIDSIIVLLVLSGYRSSIKRLVLFIISKAGLRKRKEAITTIKTDRTISVIHDNFNFRRPASIGSARSLPAITT